MADQDSVEYELARIKVVVERLTREKADLEDERDRSTREVSDLQSEVEIADEERDEAEERRAAAVESLRAVQGRTLDLLKKLEFSSADYCPLCRFPWAQVGKGKPSHAAGCSLKLEIFRLEMDLSKVLDA